MSRLLATVTDHARRAITALLEHVDAAWDCWEDGGEGAETRVTGARSDEQGVSGLPVPTDAASGVQIDDLRETQ